MVKIMIMQNHREMLMIIKQWHSNKSMGAVKDNK